MQQLSSTRATHACIASGPGRLNELAHDHAVVAELVRTGEISEEGAKDHPYCHVLTRALGVDPDVEMDHAGLPCQPGVRLELCTDVLVKVLPADDLNAVQKMT